MPGKFQPGGYCVTRRGMAGADQIIKALRERRLYFFILNITLPFAEETPVMVLVRLFLLQLLCQICHKPGK